jgi:predicted ATPase/DNA-binding winged helix-turn-helix (wHTH) protein
MLNSQPPAKQQHSARCMVPDGTRPVYASGACEIDAARRELRVHGAPVPLGARALEIIELLAQSAGELVTKDELMNRIWPGAIVTENTLQVHTVAVRKALGPYRSLLKTESRRGYRLLGEWTVRQHRASRPPIGLQRSEAAERVAATNIPAPVMRLLGRAASVQRLQDLLSAYRAVTLTGPGGIGKTTLALKVARKRLGDFPDGVWLVELASLSDPVQVPSVLAGVLKLGLRADAVAAEAVARAIGENQVLLVLDNCEHLVGAVATLAETILALCPHAAILSTSREILRIQGEHVYRVPPLDVPTPAHVDAEQILQHSASALFIARAREAGADLVATANHAAMIGAICRHLDGIPLAIEFAAALAPTLGIEQVAVGLRDRFGLLTSGRRNALPRHRTLRATLDWSHQLLTEAEQTLLHRLAIFVGPFSLQAAVAVADPDTPETDIAHGIANLVGKSLVLKVADETRAEFRLLETTRAYALDRLTESGALAKISRRHAAYFLQLLGNLEHEVQSLSPDQHLVTFRRRADEIHAALDWAFSRAGDPAIGVALTIAAVPLWFELSQLSVARGHIEQALPSAAAGSEQEMRLRIALGHALWYLGPGTDAVGLNFARALAIAERIGATAVKTRALWGLWAAHRGKGDYHTALQLALRYSDAAASAGDLGACHLADRIVALTYHLLGQQPQAQQWTERALQQPRELDPSSGMGYQVETPIAMPALLARILWIRGFPDQAAAAAAQSIAAAERSGHSFAMGYAMTFGTLPVALWTGAQEEVRRQLDLLAAHVVGIQRMEDWRLCYGRALTLRQGSEAEALVAAFIESRADPAQAPPFAHLPIDAPVPVPLPNGAAIDAPWSAPEVLRVDAMLLLCHNGPSAIAAAEARLLRALELAQQQTALSWELRAATSLARLWQRQGRAGAARELMLTTFSKFTEGFGTSDLLEARRLIAELEAGVR